MRVFIAINLPINLIENITSLINSLPKQFLNLPWQNQTNWHITLRFLGEINPEQLKTVFYIIQNIAAQFSPFVLLLQNFMAFPNLSEPRIIGLKIKNSQKLNKMVELINSQLNRLSLGQADRKKFKAHVTLARIKERVGDCNVLDEIYINEKFTVLTIDIIESLLKPDGAQYRILKSLSLNNEN